MMISGSGVQVDKMAWHGVLVGKIPHFVRGLREVTFSYSHS
jgi:hypothetical protein